MLFLPFGSPGKTSPMSPENIFTSTRRESSDATVSVGLPDVSPISKITHTNPITQLSPEEHQEESVLLSSSDEGDNSTMTTNKTTKGVTHPKPETDLQQLQHHLRKMEEAHHSTNEELQATIQELADLQSQLEVSKTENEKLKEEQTMLLESLYRQTERLQAAKVENEDLQKSIKEGVGVPEREKKLIDLLQQGQNTRESFISQNNELTQKFNEAHRTRELTEQQNSSLRETVRELEVTVEDVQFEKLAIEEELRHLKEDQSLRYFEVLRLNVLLDLEECKVKELKAAQASLGNDNELYNIVNKVMKEKEQAEVKMAESEDALKRTLSENIRLMKQVNTLQEQITTLKEITANAISDLENNTKLQKTEQKLAEEKINEMEIMSKEIKQLNGVLSQELQSATDNLRLTEEKLLVTTKQLEDCKRRNLKEKLKIESECRELQQIQEDLLVAVRVANEIKSETQLHFEKLQIKVRELEEKNASLLTQIEYLTKRDKDTVKPVEEVFKIPAPQPATPAAAATPATASVPDQKKPSARPSLQCVNVKQLIDTIENANKKNKKDSGTYSKAVSPQQEALPLRPLTNNKQSYENKDPLFPLPDKNVGSKRNALLKWVQTRVQGYSNIEITNFSSSWTDGMALCALLHTYIPNKVPYNQLSPNNRSHNFRLAFSAAESVGIPTILNMTDMQQERPDWQKVMSYIREIYTYFEGRETL
ncbi:cytospin-A-like isoform X2 [Macrosteles quadrilineatus]|uniref:cytospin-A-like isoform X2 n=1 Tax=Macrosteles quadrilineatus TaxID=74068 RepID=UPI0023E28CCF|nr:cytospin-A-like isoform X2 [Macrosteles quadrilineatus]